MACQKNHQHLLPILQQLPESQAVYRGRHRCPGCAYDKGFEDGQRFAQEKSERKTKSG